MANGSSRIVLAETVNKSQAEINKAFANENEVAKKKKFPLKNPSEHNHSK
jgi:hypothetical protein